MPLLYRHIAEDLSISDGLIALLTHFQKEVKVKVKEKPEDPEKEVSIQVIDFEALAKNERAARRANQLIGALVQLHAEIKETDIGQMFDLDVGDQLTDTLPAPPTSDGPSDAGPESDPLGNLLETP